MKVLKCFFLFLLIGLAQFLLAENIQYNQKLNEYSLESPRHTIWTHITYLQNDANRNVAIAAKTLNFDGNPSQKEKLAVYLKEILDYNDLFIIQENISDDKDFLDSTQQKNIYIPFQEVPDIYLEKVNNKVEKKDKFLFTLPIVPTTCE